MLLWGSEEFFDLTKYRIKEHFKCQANWKTFLMALAITSTEPSFGFTIMKRRAKRAISASMWRVMKLSAIPMKFEDAIAPREIPQLLIMLGSFSQVARNIAFIFNRQGRTMWTTIWDQGGNSFSLIRFLRPRNKFSFLMMDSPIKISLCSIKITPLRSFQDLTVLQVRVLGQWQWGGHDNMSSKGYFDIWLSKLVQALYRPTFYLLVIQMASSLTEQCITLL